MKKLIILASLVMASTYAYADYNGGTTCTGFYGSSVEAVYGGQGAILGKKPVTEGKSTKDQYYTLRVDGAWPYLSETKSGKSVVLDRAAMANGEIAYMSTDLSVYPSNVPGVSNGKGKVVIRCLTEAGGF